MTDPWKAAEQCWDLTDLKIIYVKTDRAVYTAESPQYGAVVVKWDSDFSQLLREAETLEKMNSGCVYGLNADEKLMLMERIMPGDTLRQEEDITRRLEAFAQVFSAIHSPAREGETYLDWLEKVCRLEDVPGILRGAGEKAGRICEELFLNYPERVLLHGDLHHDNILRRHDGSYGVIDPKGVVGPEILDLPRFLLNEKQDRGHILDAIGWLAEKFGYCVTDIGKAFYMETVLANLWNVEDGLPVDEASVLLAEEILEETICRSERQE